MPSRRRGARTAAVAFVAVVGVVACSAAEPGDPDPSAVASPSAPAPAADDATAATLSEAPKAPADPGEASVAAGPEPAEPSSAPAAPPEPEYEAAVSPTTPELAERMHASWRPGCPVPLEDLRYLRVSHRTFDDDVATGELVVHAEVADGLVEVFRTLFEVGFPIESMRLVDDFGADDDASMAANNTSAFNCRAVTGGSGWSEHSYGRAIDVNPVQNPYVRGTTVLPPAGAEYLDRPDAPGVIRAGDPVVEAFAAAGWSWGGYWRRPVDHQHFSTTNR